MQDCQLEEGRGLEFVGDYFRASHGPSGGRPKVMKGGQEGGGPVRASGNAIQVPKGLVISERSFVKETIPVVQMGGPSGRTCSLVLW